MLDTWRGSKWILHDGLALTRPMSDRNCSLLLYSSSSAKPLDAQSCRSLARIPSPKRNSSSIHAQANCIWNGLTPPPVLCCTQYQVVLGDFLQGKPEKSPICKMIAQAQDNGMHLGLYLMMSDPCAALRRRHPRQTLTSLRRSSKPEFTSCRLPTLMLHV